MSKRAGDSGSGTETAPMEQVRELLFGAQLKDMETRFQRREERFTREVADARDSMKKRLDSLETFMKSETASLLARLKEEKSALESALKDEQRERTEAVETERAERAEALKTEQRERAEALAKLTKDLAALNDAMDRKVSRLTDSLDDAERNLRDLLLAESGGLSDKIEEKYRESLSVLSKTAAQIRQDMVYRSSLSSMLTEVAVKLSGQWTLELESGQGGMEETVDDADE